MWVFQVVSFPQVYPTRIVEKNNRLRISETAEAIEWAIGRKSIRNVDVALRL